LQSANTYKASEKDVASAKMRTSITPIAAGLFRININGFGKGDPIPRNAKIAGRLRGRLSSNMMTKTIAL